VRGVSMLFMFVFHYHFVVSTVGDILGIDTPFVQASANFFYYGIDQKFLTLVFMFPLMSGITSTFHSDNLKPFVKAGKFIAVAAAISIATYVIGDILDTQILFIRFGIIHMLALSMLIYAFVNLYTDRLCKRFFDKSKNKNAESNNELIQTQKSVETLTDKQSTKFAAPNISQIIKASVLIAMGLTIVIVGLVLQFPIDNDAYSNNFAWLGLTNGNYMSGDYFPMLPYSGYFFLGSGIGKLIYAKRQTLLPKLQNLVVFRPFATIGKSALIFYVLHVVGLFAIFYLIFSLL